MNDVLDFDRAAGRIGRNMVWIAAVGTVAAFAARGWRWAGGFLLGAAISWWNYRWLRKLVESLGGKIRLGGVRFALRYLLLAGGAYAILRFSPISVAAVFVGLFVLIAAVFAEAIFEIFYAGKRTLDHQDLQ
jgi:hypothetical protein